MIPVTLVSSRVEFPVLKHVERDVQNIRIPFECLLYAIAMVDIPIQDEDFATFVTKILLAHLGCYSDIVEETEPSRFVVLGMVSWRPNNSDSIAYTSCSYIL